MTLSHRLNIEFELSAPVKQGCFGGGDEFRNVVRNLGHGEVLSPVALGVRLSNVPEKLVLVIPDTKTRVVSSLMVLSMLPEVVNGVDRSWLTISVDPDDNSKLCLFPWTIAHVCVIDWLTLLRPAFETIEDTQRSNLGEDKASVSRVEDMVGSGDDHIDRNAWVCVVDSDVKVEIDAEQTVMKSVADVIVRVEAMGQKVCRARIDAVAGGVAAVSCKADGVKLFEDHLHYPMPLGSGVGMSEVGFLDLHHALFECELREGFFNSLLGPPSLVCQEFHENILVWESFGCDLEDIGCIPLGVLVDFCGEGLKGGPLSLIDAVWGWGWVHGHVGR